MIYDFIIDWISCGLAQFFEARHFYARLFLHSGKLKINLGETPRDLGEKEDLMALSDVR